MWHYLLFETEGNYADEAILTLNDVCGPSIETDIC